MDVDSVVLDVVADDGERRRVPLLGVGEEAPRLEVDVEHRRDVRGEAGDRRVAQLLLAGADRLLLIRLRADRPAGLALLLDDAHVAERHRLALAGQDELRTVPDEPVLREDQDVGVEVHDLRRHVVVQAADDGEDRDDRHHADDDAEERQAGAELVAPERLDRDREKLREPHRFITSRCPSPRAPSAPSPWRRRRGRRP